MGYILMRKKGVWTLGCRNKYATGYTDKIKCDSFTKLQTIIDICGIYKLYTDIMNTKEEI